MKYKFALNPKIRGYVEWQIEHYHEDKKQLEEYRASLIPSATPSYSPAGGIQSGGVSNPTEQAGIKLATSPYILATEQTIRAVSAALEKCDDTDKKLIDLIYWRRAYTIEGAGMRIGLSRRAAYYRVNNIICIVALEMGLINP